MIDKIKKAYLNINIDELKKDIIYVFIFGFIAHGFCYFNANFSHDSLFYIYKTDTDVMLGVGRFIRPIYCLIRGGNTLPLINGIVSLLYISIASYLLIDIYHITNKCLKILVCGIMATNFSFTILNASFIHDADAYMFSMMLAIAAAKVLQQDKKYWFISLFIIIISLGLYQTYMSITVFILLSISLIRIIHGEEVRDTISNLIKQFLVILVAMIVYYAIYKLILFILNLPPVDTGNNIGNISSLSIEYLIAALFNTIRSEIRWFRNPRRYNDVLSILINITLFLLLIVALVKTAKNNNIKKSNCAAAILIIIVLPFGINIITLLSSTYHDLTLYPLVMFYIFVIAIINEAVDHNILQVENLTRILLGVLIIDNCFYSNECYVKKSLENESTLSLYTRIVDRIEQTDGYKIGETRIAFIGSINSSDLAIDMNGFDYGAIGINNHFSTNSNGKIVKYFEYYLGYPPMIANDREVLQYSQLQEVIDMPCFPNKGSVVLIDDIVVVKLSN